ncbi:uncharacterized protein TNCT_510051 [Trichonephila clavata]|uniref:Uncharacterized protein n=1 Tax=Trichonephila clavata TaxID=2740835 RepID=A0A8X6H7B3_TRICU|nr:uncharacterized protein TNCT_510051 [Trichonephila clavata]
MLMTSFVVEMMFRTLYVLPWSVCKYSVTRACCCANGETNSKQLDLLWQQEGIETEFSETSATDLKPPIKVLGLAWDSEKDLIYFDPKDLLKFMSRKTESKRFILSVVGRIFDPVEFLAHSLSNWSVFFKIFGL